MICVQDKRRVSISYKIRDNAQHIVEEIMPSRPFVYIHGYGNIIPGLERALENRAVGETFKVALRYTEAYGPYRRDMIIEVPKVEMEDVGELWVGMELESVHDWMSSFHVPEYPEDIYEGEEDEDEDEYEGEPDEPEVYTVKEIREESVILDGNHPFAGMDLNFEVTVLGVEQPSFTELESGFPDEPEQEEGDDSNKHPKRHWL